jgi:pyrroloquinoline quinone biosynthesis protein B
MGFTVYILGSAQDAGLPQLGSRMAPDNAARLDPLAVRLGPSLAVLDDEGRCLLVDASPDIREQESRLLKVKAYAARKGKNPFDAVVLTHAHIGHYLGLAHFGRECANTDSLPVWCTARMAQFLRGNAPWDQLIQLRNIAINEVVWSLTPDVKERQIKPWKGLTLRLIPVPHRSEYTDTVAISINGKLLYAPDVDNWDAWEAAKKEVKAHKVSVLDGTFYSPDELPGRNLKEVSHPMITDTLKKFGDLTKTRRLVLSHFNHSNPVCDPGSKQAKSVTKAGFELAQDMMAIEL